MIFVKKRDIFENKRLFSYKKIYFLSIKDQFLQKDVYDAYAKAKNE